MRFPRMAAIGAAALALGGSAAALSAGPALATSPTATSIIDFKASPATISVGHTQVTLTGKLVESSDPSDGLAGEEVWVNYVGLIKGSTSPTMDWVSGDTGTGGAFSITLTLAGGSTFQGSFSGDSSYAASWSPSVNVDSAAEPTRVVLNPLPKLVKLNTTLHLTGTAEAEGSNGKWSPLSGVNIAAGVNKFLFWNATSKANGTFSIAADAAQPGTWQAEAWTGFAPQDALYARTPSNADQVNLEYTTKVSSWSAAVKSAAHHTVTIKGTVQSWEYSATSASSFAWVGTSGLTVTYYYRDLPSGNWVKAGTGKTGAKGAFASTVTAKAGDLRWKVVISRQSIAGNVYLATTTGTKDTEVKG